MVKDGLRLPEARGAGFLLIAMACKYTKLCVISCVMVGFLMCLCILFTLKESKTVPVALSVDAMDAGSGDGVVVQVLQGS